MEGKTVRTPGDDVYSFSSEVALSYVDLAFCYTYPRPPLVRLIRVTNVF